jgi:hypothetical protein
MDYSVSLGITPKNYSPEEILNLPEQIAAKMDIHIVVCIDEFQQSISELLAQCSPLFIQQIADKHISVLPEKCHHFFFLCGQFLDHQINY